MEPKLYRKSLELVRFANRNIDKKHDMISDGSYLSSDIIIYWVYIMTPEHDRIEEKKDKDGKNEIIIKRSSRNN